jgi:hypothetical protein
VVKRRRELISHPIRATRTHQTTLYVQQAPHCMYSKHHTVCTAGTNTVCTAGNTLYVQQAPHCMYSRHHTVCTAGTTGTTHLRGGEEQRVCGHGGAVGHGEAEVAPHELLDRQQGGGLALVGGGRVQPRVGGALRHPHLRDHPALCDFS